MATPEQRRAILDGWHGRPTVALIDLDVLAGNVTAFRRLVPAPTRLMAVVKADGYGHGAVPIAATALAAGADELAVATVGEGAHLRQAGIEAPILVMGPVGVNEPARALALNLTLTVGTVDGAEAIAEARRELGLRTRVPVHLKIDTGMRRYGVTPEQAPEMARWIARSGHLDLAAVMTHFAAADDPDPAFTVQQATIFDTTCDAIRAAGVTIPEVHLANSAATIRFPALHRDRVRVGIALYGLRPNPTVDLPDGVHPVMTVHSRVARVFTVAAGETVSYGRTWTAPRDTLAGLVPLGYADGYRRQGSGSFCMAVNGEVAPVLGRICMDQTVVQVPDGTRPGDAVLVAGDGTDGTDGTVGVAPTLEDLAASIGTISYELATGLVAPRVPHLYVRSGALIAISDVSGYRALDRLPTQPGAAPSG